VVLDAQTVPSIDVTAVRMLVTLADGACASPWPGTWARYGTC
jgi:hypothetical protein